MDEELEIVNNRNWRDMLANTKWDCSTGLIHILWSLGDLIVRTSKASDLKFVDKIQKENSHAVGFIQKTIWSKYVYGGERNFIVLICEMNLDPVGYVLITPGRGTESYGKIQQIAVRQD